MTQKAKPLSELAGWHHDHLAAADDYRHQWQSTSVPLYLKMLAGTVDDAEVERLGVSVTPSGRMLRKQS